ncbi:hypothetical protein BJ912DRAFT_1063923 [Pholiota molesta]|nr:hypothetical protein BJ912DRAFT_1063923 [Pholiota molesta]
MGASHFPQPDRDPDSVVDLRLRREEGQREHVEDQHLCGGFGKILFGGGKGGTYHQDQAEDAQMFRRASPYNATSADILLGLPEGRPAGNVIERSLRPLDRLNSSAGMMSENLKSGSKDDKAQYNGKVLRYASFGEELSCPRGDGGVLRLFEPLSPSTFTAHTWHPIAMSCTAAAPIAPCSTAMGAMGTQLVHKHARQVLMDLPPDA